MKTGKEIITMALALLILVTLTGCRNDSGVLAKANATVMEATTMHLRKTEGSVAISDKDNKDVQARESLNLYSGYGVGTESASFAWVDLDSVKLTKLDESSKVLIEKDGKKLSINLESGNLYFHVTKPLQDDESMSIRTSTMAIGIRGTCGWVEMSEDTSKVYLLEGKVEVESLEGNEITYVNAGQVGVVNEDGTITVDSFDGDAIPAFVLNETVSDDGLKQMVEEMAAEGESEEVVVAGDSDENVEYKEKADVFVTNKVDNGDGKMLDFTDSEWVGGPFTINGSVDIYSDYGTKIGYTKPNVTVDGVNKLRDGKWMWVPFEETCYYVKAEDFGKFVAAKPKNENQNASAKTGNTGNAQKNENKGNGSSGSQTATAQNNGNTNNQNNGNTGNQVQPAEPVQTQPTAPTETVVTTPEPAPVEPATPAYSEAEVIGIYEGALRAAGMRMPSEVFSAEDMEGCGPDAGMGWAISDIPINDAQGFAARDVSELQFSGYNMYYLESLGSSDGVVRLKVYRGTN